MLTILLVALAVTLAALFCVLVGASQQVDALNDQIDWRDARIEDLENELRHHQRGRHPAGRGLAAVPSSIRACWENDAVIHICGDPDRCEELDPRPPVDAMTPAGGHDRRPSTPASGREVPAVPPAGSLVTGRGLRVVRGEG